MGEESFSNLFCDNLPSDGSTVTHSVGMPLCVETNSGGWPPIAPVPRKDQGGQVSVGGRDAMLNWWLLGSSMVLLLLLEDICDLTEPENQGMLGEDGIRSENLWQGAGRRTSADPHPMTFPSNKRPLIRGFANERTGRTNTIQAEIFPKLGAQRMQVTCWGFKASLGEAFLFAQVARGLLTKPVVPELLSRNHSRDGGSLVSLSLPSRRKASCGRAGLSEVEQGGNDGAQR